MKSQCKKSLVSTIIPVYNRSKQIVEAVQSVLDQSYRPIEIIVVDDGSTDETSAVVDALAEKWSDEITVLHITNGGPGTAREAGRLMAHGEFIQYLDSDDVLLPQKFEWQVKGLREHPEYGASYGKTRFRALNENKASDVPLKRTGEKIEHMFPSFLLSRWWSTLTPLFRRTLVDKAGPWEPLLNEEDWEYDCRLASFGVKLHYVPEFICEVREHPGERLCRDGSVDPRKLASRAKAHDLILHHAMRAKIEYNSTEMIHFSKELFLLSRQCGAAGLIAESRHLFDLSRKSAGVIRARGAKFRIYYFLCSILGWGSIGWLTCFYDRVVRS